MMKTSSVYAVLCNVTDEKSTQEISEVGISVASDHSVLHKDLSMCYISQELVPKMLTPEHKET
jgi:hypothetical protein